MTGGKPKRVRMKVISRTHMENKCPCFLARRDGRVCAHAIAGEAEQAAEIKRLKRELARVTEERTILKKATAYFARESQ